MTISLPGGISTSHSMTPCSIFPYDERAKVYLDATQRARIATLAEANKDLLTADPEVAEDPEKYFDLVVEIDLDTLEPHIVGPFTPDLARPVSKMAADVAEHGYPDNLTAGLIGSCTNSSYQDLMLVASVLKGRCVHPDVELGIAPGSRQVLNMLAENGALAELVRSPKLEEFARLKTDLPLVCRDCEFLPYCNAGCPKHHIPDAATGDPHRVNHFCEGYKLFFREALPELKRMAEALKRGQVPRPAGQAPRPVPTNRPVGRNDPCPCGSGRKYKHCCGRE